MDHPWAIPGSVPCGKILKELKCTTFFFLSFLAHPFVHLSLALILILLDIFLIIPPGAVSVLTVNT